MTTAEGGAVTWNPELKLDNEELYKEYQLFSLHGQSKDALSKSQKGAWEYDIVYPGYKCNMTDIQAALGLVQLERYENLLKRRREIVELYDKKLTNVGIQTIEHYTENSFSSGHLYLTRVEGINEDQRNKIINEMAEAGIATNVHYKPLPMFTAYKRMGFDIKNYPNAFGFYQNEITLPLHTLLSDEEINYITDKYIEIIEKYR